MKKFLAIVLSTSIIVGSHVSAMEQKVHMPAAAAAQGWTSWAWSKARQGGSAVATALSGAKSAVTTRVCGGVAAIKNKLAAWYEQNPREARASMRVGVNVTTFVTYLASVIGGIIASGASGIGLTHEQGFGVLGFSIGVWLSTLAEMWRESDASFFGSYGFDEEAIALDEAMKRLPSNSELGGCLATLMAAEAGLVLLDTGRGLKFLGSIALGACTYPVCTALLSQGFESLVLAAIRGRDQKALKCLAERIEAFRNTKTCFFCEMRVFYEFCRRSHYSHQGR